MNWDEYPITHGYITSYDGVGTDTPHPALDIGTPFHTPLTAPLAGTVEKADYQGWGGEIYILPDDKSYPEYLFFHPDELEVGAGQHVAAGQEIALSGGENPGYPGALHPADPQYSTGAHTHLQWVTGYETTPDGRSIPNGPNPTNLLEIAQGVTPSSSTSVLSDPVSNAITSSLGITPSGLGRVGIGGVGIGLIIVGLYAIIAPYVKVSDIVKAVAV